MSSKLFADNTSLFSVIDDSNTSALELNSDLAKINRWAFKWKMSFNPDPKNQAQEVIFSQICKAISHPQLVFNNNNVIQATSQKHLGIILHTRSFYKAFVRPHLDYCDILYDKAHNASFHQKLESFQYNACLAITEAIHGSSREKLGSSRF